MIGICFFCYGCVQWMGWCSQHPYFYTRALTLPCDAIVDDSMRFAIISLWVSDCVVLLCCKTLWGFVILGSTQCCVLIFFYWFWFGAGSFWASLLTCRLSRANPWPRRGGWRSATTRTEPTAPPLPTSARPWRRRRWGTFDAVWSCAECRMHIAWVRIARRYC